MRREGNEILFDSDEQKRLFIETISIAEGTEALIKAAMKATLSIEYDARAWWQAAKKLCSSGEQPIYLRTEEKLVVETCEPESALRWQANDPLMDYLRRAKEYCVAEQKWDLADAIRLLMDEHKRAETAQIAQ